MKKRLVKKFQYQEYNGYFDTTNTFFFVFISFVDIILFVWIQKIFVFFPCIHARVVGFYREPRDIKKRSPSFEKANVSIGKKNLAQFWEHKSTTLLQVIPGH